MVCSGPFSTANKSPSAAATQMQMLSPDSCDGGLEEGEEWPISMSFSRQEGSFQNYRMRRRTKHHLGWERLLLGNGPFQFKKPDKLFISEWNVLKSDCNVLATLIFPCLSSLLSLCGWAWKATMTLLFYSATWTLLYLLGKVLLEFLMV